MPASTCIHRSGLSLAHPVGMKICQNPVGTFGVDRPGLSRSDNCIPDRDYPRPSKETRPGLFRLVPAHTFHSSHADHPLFPCVTNLIVAPVTLCWTLKFRNWLFFVSFHAYISNPGRVSCVTDRYYFHLFFYPDRGYKPANSEEKHSKCYLKPAKEPIRLQKKIVLCKSYMFFHLHLF